MNNINDLNLNDLNFMSGLVVLEFDGINAKLKGGY
jgi:hypothetical protein